MAKPSGAPDMPLLQPSFRGRLRLFFAVIVIVPIIAVGFVLFRLIDTADDLRADSSLNTGLTVAQTMYGDYRRAAAPAIETIQNDVPLATALDSNQPKTVERRLDALLQDTGARRIVLTVQDVGTFSAGTDTGIAAAVQDLVSADRSQSSRLIVSMIAADRYAGEVARTLDLDVRVDRDKDVLASTLPRAARASIPNDRGAEVTLGADVYRTTFFTAEEPDRTTVTVRLLTPASGSSRNRQLLLIGLVIAFLALAFVCAVALSRTLSSEIQRLLFAAQRLGRGDFTVQVPAEGNDEFAALGKEFNKMASELEGRLEELRTERSRLQDAIRRVGESFARGLDRVGVLEIVVQTAVDGVGGDCGRATMRRRAEAPMEEVATTGDPGLYYRVLHAAEAAVMDAGQAAEISLGGSSALAAPLSATEGGDRVLAIVSVARGDRAFSAQERELFYYLTSQAAVSVENVDLHETVQRQAVTDELTGLFNHRRFQEVMDAEVERARRYDAEMGLIMLDLDNFKRVNDTYGHMQGDEVLRAVARVLRQSAREIDEPARYGGEEMAVALPQTDLDGAYNFAERVRKRIEALELPLLDGDGVLKVTASFGAASLVSSPQSDKEGLVAAADAALYRAKRSGKNRTVKAE